MAGETGFRLTVEIVDVEKFAVRPQGVGLRFGSHPRKPFLVIGLDSLDPPGFFQLLERLALAPRKRRAVRDGVLLVSLRLLEGFGVPFPEAHPFDLLLEEAERAAAAGAPGIVFRKPETGAVEDLKDVRLVDSRFPERQPDDQIVVFRSVAFPVLLVAANRDVTVNLDPGGQRRPKPLTAGVLAAACTSAFAGTAKNRCTA